jgi:hypothetical protein
MASHDCFTHQMSGTHVETNGGHTPQPAGGVVTDFCSVFGGPNATCLGQRGIYYVLMCISMAFTLGFGLFYFYYLSKIMEHNRHVDGGKDDAEA